MNHGDWIEIIMKIFGVQKTTKLYHVVRMKNIHSIGTTGKNIHKNLKAYQNHICFFVSNAFSLIEVM